MRTFSSPLELAQAIYQALDELRVIDRQAAGELRRAVEAKPLGELTNDDYERVCARVAAQSADVPPTGPESYMERDYGLFLDAIPSGRILLTDIESLASVAGFDDLVEAANRVFVDRLGYTRAHLDESDRTFRSEFGRIVRVGNFGEMDVVCVSLTSANRYAQFYDVIFRFHPYAILLSLEPEARALRFVYREGPSAPPRYRVLTGRNTDWEPNDNLLVWAWRLHQLRPCLGEAAQTLQRRAARALSLCPEDVGMDWPSREVDPALPLTGVAWEEAPRRAFESFVQLDTEPALRHRWGLDAVLRDRFPIRVGGKSGGQLNLIRWELGPEPPSVATCLRRGVDRVRDVGLALELRHDGARVPVSLRATLPEPDDDGCFVLEGLAYRFTAVVRADGRLVALPDLEETDVEEAQEPDLANNVIEDDVDTEPTSDDNEDEPAPNGGFRGLSPRAFYEFSVSRKLAGLAYILWRARAHEPVSEAWLLQHVLRFARRLDHLPLGAWTVLRRFLVPDQGRSPIRASEWRLGGVPPSWACLDLSATLACGSFAPVAGARLHPTGSLAVPLQAQHGVRLELSAQPATEVNPRATGAATAAPPIWWTARELEAFASLRTGGLSQPWAAAQARSLSGRVARAKGPERRAFLADTVSCPRPAPRTLRSVIPSRDEAPTLLTDTGSWVEQGTAWLRVQPGAWRIDDWKLAPAEDLALELLKRTGDPEVVRAIEHDPRLISRVPTGLAGVVTHASLERLTGPLGTTHGWVARLEIQPPAPRTGVLLGPDGQAYFVEGPSRPQCDMPFDCEGAIDIRVEGPDTIARSFSLTDPLSEESIDVEFPGGQWRFAPIDVTSPESFLRRHAVDGEWMPTPAGPLITERARLRWLLLDGDAARPLSPQATWTGTFRHAAVAAGLPLTADLTPAPEPTPVVDGCMHDPTRTRIDHSLSEPAAGAAFRLPVAVIHPWRREAAAAVLGLTSDELGQVVQRHGLRSVVIALLGSLEGDVTATAARRVEIEANRSARLQVAEGLRRLRALGTARLDERLLLRAVAIPSLALVPVGLPPGVGQAVRTPLLRAYRGVELAAELWLRLADDVGITMRLAEVELQRCVDVLFGKPGSTDSDGRTLAGWLTRAYPLTRSATSRLTHPRLQMVATPEGPRTSLATGRRASLLPVTERTPRPAEPAWWAQRAARLHLASELLPWFVGLFATYDDRQEPDLPAPPGGRGRWLAREWLRRVEHPSSRPQRLAEILESRIPLTLPTELERATRVVEPILKSALPGDDAGGVALRAVLLELLVGFWSGSTSRHAPEGWTWCGHDDARPRDARRALPPLSSPAWALWPCVELATSAPRLVTSLADGCSIPALLRFVTGLQPTVEQPVVELEPPVEVEVKVDSTSTVETTRDLRLPHASPPVAPASVLAPPATDNDVHLTSMGLGHWLASTRSPEEL